jgi:hypothetical protein
MVSIHVFYWSCQVEKILIVKFFSLPKLQKDHKLAKWACRQRPFSHGPQRIFFLAGKPTSSAGSRSTKPDVRLIFFLVERVRRTLPTILSLPIHTNQILFRLKKSRYYFILIYHHHHTLQGKASSRCHLYVFTSHLTGALELGILMMLMSGRRAAADWPRFVFKIS